MSSEFKHDIHDLLIISLCYTLSFSLVILNSGIFWDDWILYGNSAQNIIARFRSAGNAQSGYLHSFFQSLPHPILMYRLTVFVSYLFSAFALYYILKNIVKERTTRFFIIILCSLFPVNHCRFTMISATSAVYYLAFSLAAIVLFRPALLSKITFRIAAIVLFIFSFAINSFLVLYVFVFVCALLIEWSGFHSKIAFTRYALTRTDFIVLPFAFYIYKLVYLAPYGSYLEYNRLSFDGVIHAFKWSPVSIYTSFIEPLLYSFDTLSYSVLLGGILLGSRILSSQVAETSADHHNKFFFIGLAFFCAANFPYLAVYKLPQLFNDWENRNQLLIPLGASFMLYFGGRIIFDAVRVPCSIQIYLFALIVMLFAKTNIEFQIMYERDALKQLALIENIKNSNIMRDNSAFVFDDRALDNNVNQRIYRTYEYAGILRTALPDGNRIGMDISDLSGFAENTRTTHKADSSSQNKEILFPQYRITIENGEYHLTVPNMVRLKLRQFFTPKEFTQNIVKVVKLSYFKL